ncbi:DUF4142 domain-containing protein [Dokdonella sp.]|uniref:DUF4142 domain-containing protein n=1 Tax=Dokdonella sp. TaxID=2291710 RepID=UPI003783C574
MLTYRARSGIRSVKAGEKILRSLPQPKVVTMRSHMLAVAFAFVSMSAMGQMREAIEVPAGALAPADVDFLQTVDTSNIDQLTFGKRIMGRKRTGVRSLAENVVSSHAKADDAVRLLAAAKHVQLDHRMSARAKGEADEIIRKDVNADRMYVENVVRDGNDLIALYQRTRDQSADPDIRKFAEQMLPALESNTRQADDLLKRMGE